MFELFCTYQSWQKWTRSLSTTEVKLGKRARTVIIEAFDQCVWRVLKRRLLEHYVPLLFFPNPSRMFLLHAWHVITILICLVSLSPLTLFSPPAPPLTFSNSLWKPKELVRAWLTPDSSLLLFPTFMGGGNPCVVCVCVGVFLFLMCVHTHLCVCDTGVLI